MERISQIVTIKSNIVKNSNSMIGILRAVTEVTGVSEGDIRGRDRKREVANARGIYYNVCHISGIHPKIYAEFIERKRTTAINMAEKYGEYCISDSDLSGMKSEVLNRLNIVSDDVEEVSGVLTEPLWTESHYIADMGSRYFGECHVGMENGDPVCGGGYYEVQNRMIDKRKRRDK